MNEIHQGITIKHHEDGRITYHWDTDEVYISSYVLPDGVEVGDIVEFFPHQVQLLTYSPSFRLYKGVRVNVPISKWHMPCMRGV